jgi:hypothetical protein
MTRLYSKLKIEFGGSFIECSDSVGYGFNPGLPLPYSLVRGGRNHEHVQYNELKSQDVTTHFTTLPK